MIILPNSSWEPLATSKSPNQDSKDMSVLCTFKMRIESKSLNMGVSKTSNHIQIRIMMHNSSQESLAYSKAPNQNIKDMDVLCNSNTHIESQKSKNCSIKDQ